MTLLQGLWFPQNRPSPQQRESSLRNHLWKWKPGSPVSLIGRKSVPEDVITFGESEKRVLYGCKTIKLRTRFGL